jgi:hypothetical protein
MKYAYCAVFLGMMYTENRRSFTRALAACSAAHARRDSSDAPASARLPAMAWLFSRSPKASSSERRNDLWLRVPDDMCWCW